MAWERVLTLNGNNSVRYTCDPDTYNYRIASDSTFNNNVKIRYGLNGGSLIYVDKGATKALTPPKGENIFTAEYYGTNEIFLERERKNVAPTKPGAFKSPVSGTSLKGGTSIKIEFGASTDENGDTLTYNLYAQYNGTGDWQSLSIHLTEPKMTTTLTRDTSITKVQYRVRANDPGNYYSDYQYSPVYTVYHETAPTTPGSFTQPTGTLEMGDMKVFTVGAASDAENNLAKYVWEVSVNNGAYTNVGETTTPSVTYTIPTATSLKMRVKAVDDSGLESPYKESDAFTVTKPKYYWSKYTALGVTTYQDNAPWVYQRREFTSYKTLKYSKSYTFSTSNNRYTASATLWDDSPVSVGGAAYTGGGSTITKYEAEDSVAGASLSFNAKVYTKNASSNTGSTTYSRGSLVESDIVAEQTTYTSGTRNSDGYWYVRGSRVSQSIAPPGTFTAPAINTKFKPGELVTVAFEASSAPNVSMYEFQFRYPDAGENTWQGTPSLTRTLTITTDKAYKTIEFRVRAMNTSNVYSDYVYSGLFEIEHNSVPIVELTSPTGATTLYENSTYRAAGTVLDTDNGNTVTVRYQINGLTTRSIKAYLSDGATAEAFEKVLTFKNGNLYDGETLIASNLAEGVEHVLKVFAIDDQGGTSAVVEHTFMVVPNRNPILTVDNLETQTDLLGSDTVTITGTVDDPDGNAVTVTVKLGNSDPVQIYSGGGGTWEYAIPVDALQTGTNQVVFTSKDSYNATYSVTKTITRHEEAAPLAAADIRYKIIPPAGSMQGLTAWVEHDNTLEVFATISMDAIGATEDYVTMENTNNAPTSLGMEAEYVHEADAAQENVVLRLELEGEGAITLISGVLV